MDHGGFAMFCEQHVAGRILESLPQTQVFLAPTAGGFIHWGSSWIG